MQKQFLLKASFGALLAATLSLSTRTAEAAEGGAGFYLLGTRGPAAAALPPPGTYFQNDVYIYSGEMSGGRGFPAGGRIVADIDATAVIELPTFIWMTPVEILGGDLGFSASLPVGYKKISADLSVISPRLGTTINRGTSDDTMTVGDPVITSMIGWHTGEVFWQTGVSVNVPIGDYHDGDLSNISFNHWGADVYGAATWMEPTTGIDFSAAVGMTFNAENPATDYRSGNEFHLEWAVSKTFSPQWSAGLIGYHYDQVSGDSGKGAVLGDYKGRVTAIGATIGYNFLAGTTPVAARLKLLHEFGAENRAEGDVAFLTISIPIGEPSAHKATKD